MNKQFLEECCNWMSGEIRSETRTVTFFSGLKPYNYFFPKLITTKSAISGDADKIINAWFVEIFVNDKCIFRESYVPKENEDLSIVEEMVIGRILKNVFSYGIMASKQQIEEIYQFIGKDVL